MKAGSPFAGPIAVISAGAALVCSTFALFGSILKDLLPQMNGADRTVNFVALGTLVVFLSLTPFIRARSRVVTQRLWAAVGILCCVGAIFLYFSFDEMALKYTFRYPNGVPETAQRLVIRGEYHAKGKELLAGRDVASAVAALGGVDTVFGFSLLWEKESRDYIINRFVRYYAAIVFLITTALFTVVIVVWRNLKDKEIKHTD
ncbi:hypothetical protein [Duganella sp. Root198D2]|uniref:hypothetical protein n=1 Tax=Duganella sp. Root198D2 TaxID=1736489 RepID=UPI00070FA44A|nr:hypothetical protein [Duganella sp. Root198D2]